MAAIGNDRILVERIHIFVDIHIFRRYTIYRQQKFASVSKAVRQNVRMVSVLARPSESTRHFYYSRTIERCSLFFPRNVLAKYLNENIIFIKVVSRNFKGLLPFYIC